MKCIENKKTGKIKRVRDEEARKAVTSGEYHYTTKEAYKRQLKEDRSPLG